MSSVQMLPQPTLQGKVQGIVGLDPIAIQCGVCGLVKTNDGDDYIRVGGAFILMAGIKFCPTDKVRRCCDCRTEHATSCDRCASADR